jgi:hypothetical protein
MDTIAGYRVIAIVSIVKPIVSIVVKKITKQSSV